MTDADPIIAALPGLLRLTRFRHARGTGELTFDSLAKPLNGRVNRRTLGAAMQAIGAVKHTSLKDRVRYRFPDCYRREEALALVDAAVIRYFSR